MSEHFSVQELRNLARLLGYTLQELRRSPECCYALMPTEAARFTDAHLNVPPVEKQELNQWELYSKLAFAIERFVAELMGKVREGLRNPNVFADGEHLRELSEHFGVPVEYMQPHLGWDGAFMLADKLMGKAKALHGAQMLYVREQKKNPL